MITLKKLLFIGILTAHIIGIKAVSMVGFDPSLLNPYIIRAQKITQAVADELEDEIMRNGGSIYWRDPSYSERLYPLQRAALKEILKELKHAAISVKNGDQSTYHTARQLSKAFKYNVYKSWKKSQIILGITNNRVIGRSKKPIITLE